MADPAAGEGAPKLGLRNMLKGTLVHVRKDGVAAPVQIDIVGGKLVTSAIASDSANRLALEEGKAVTAKASDVMLAIDD